VRRGRKGDRILATPAGVAKRLDAPVRLDHWQGMFACGHARTLRLDDGLVGCLE
jgi:hypothetical protein